MNMRAHDEAAIARYETGARWKRFLLHSGGRHSNDRRRWRRFSTVYLCNANQTKKKGMQEIRLCRGLRCRWQSISYVDPLNAENGKNTNRCMALAETTRLWILCVCVCLVRWILGQRAGPTWTRQYSTCERAYAALDGARNLWYAIIYRYSPPFSVYDATAFPWNHLLRCRKLEVRKTWGDVSVCADHKTHRSSWTAVRVERRDTMDYSSIKIEKHK